MKNIIVLGGGFAGFWSAAGAARKLAELGIGGDEAQITLIEKNPFHSIRVRNYEEDIDATIIPFNKILDPIGVRHVQGEVLGIDTSNQTVSVATGNNMEQVRYDRLVYALGSQLYRPPIPGLAEYSFDVDTCHGAKRLDRHLASLPTSSRNKDRFTVLVVGAGLTGIEVAAELPDRLAKIRGTQNDDAPIRVILADSRSRIGSDMGEQAQAVIDEALEALGVETREEVAIASVSKSGVTLEGGEFISTPTVIWCAGMRANEMAATLPFEKDKAGRILVDRFLRVKNGPNIFAAGDAASATVCEGHQSVMSCQHGRPMGRYAGHNVVADLFGEPMLALNIDWYTTVLDLGPWGAVYTIGWDRQVISTGATAKKTKQTINRQRIYPPLTGMREDILAAAAPEIQAPPEVVSRVV